MPSATSVCSIHGDHEGEVCRECYALQQERVERESIPLRYANTTESLRRRVIEKRAHLNGHAP